MQFHLMPEYKFFHQLLPLCSKVVKIGPSETVGNTFSPVTKVMTGEKVPALKNSALSASRLVV